MDSGVSYYDVLGVTKDASDDVIREAYKKMALRWHPDKNLDNITEAKMKFTQISEAYKVLSSCEKRARYDRRGRCELDSDCCDSDDDMGAGFQYFMAQELYELIFKQFFASGIYERENQYGFQSRQWPSGQRPSGQQPSAGQRERAPRRSSATIWRSSNDSKTGGSAKEPQVKTSTRTVNGKKWVTKTYIENGREVVERYEDGDLISKRVGGVEQTL